MPLRRGESCHRHHIPAEGMGRPSPPRGSSQKKTRWAKDTRCKHCDECFESRNQLHHHLHEVHGISENMKPLRGKSWADLADEEDEEMASKDPRNWSPERQAKRVLQVAEDMNIVRNFLKCKSDVAEAFSPPRVTEEASACRNLISTNTALDAKASSSAANAAIQ